MTYRQLFENLCRDCMAEGEWDKVYVLSALLSDWHIHVDGFWNRLEWDHSMTQYAWIETFIKESFKAQGGLDKVFDRSYELLKEIAEV